MRLKRSTIALALVIWLIPGAVLAETSIVLRNARATLEMTLKTESWKASGIYLGQGLVLTARHVAHPVGITHPQVLIENIILPGEPLKEGNGVDLTLLKIDYQKLMAPLRNHLISLCSEPPRAGQSVITVSSEGVAHSKILDPSLLPGDIPTQFSTVIEDSVDTGNSGSGVFDEKTDCLLGIISQRIDRIMTSKSKEGQVSTTRESIAKFFEPASKIREFVSPWMR